MALLKPFAYQIVPGGRWGPSKRADEPTGWWMADRFWFQKPVAAAGGPFVLVPHFHPALDLAAPLGTPIQAMETGKITKFGTNPTSPSSGLRIGVEIRPGSTYGHGHLQGYATNPRTKKQFALGDKVLRGEIYCYVGCTGVCTGPHAHSYLQLVVPGTKQPMLYNLNLFFPYGANANDPRIKPLN